MTDALPAPSDGARSRKHSHPARGRGQAARPVLLYSIGKDSSVLLHLARKAFFPARPPFPLLHIDTTWKFRAMIRHRDATRAANTGWS